MFLDHDDSYIHGMYASDEIEAREQLLPQYQHHETAGEISNHRNQAIRLVAQSSLYLSIFILIGLLTAVLLSGSPCSCELGPEGRLFFRICVWAVSYTHLTLPTKRIV